ncbi:hypothetical protein SEVIR_2G415850v4 [Setaria viridis]
MQRLSFPNSPPFLTECLTVLLNCDRHVAAPAADVFMHRELVTLPHLKRISHRPEGAIDFRSRPWTRSSAYIVEALDPTPTPSPSGGAGKSRRARATGGGNARDGAGRSRPGRR